jgi:hypothetical protein
MFVSKRSPYQMSRILLRCTTPNPGARSAGSRPTPLALRILGGEIAIQRRAILKLLFPGFAKDQTAGFGSAFRDDHSDHLGDAGQPSETDDKSTADGISSRSTLLYSGAGP